MKFTKLLVLGALLLTGSGVAKAVDANVWQKPTIAAPEVTTFTTYEVGKTIYLYNVASHLFYTNGNNWATRASLIFATGGDGNGATAGQAIRGIKVEFQQTDAAKALGDDVVELKSDVKGAGSMLSSFADGWAGIWTDNNTNPTRFWKVTANGDFYQISNTTTEPDKFLGWQGEFTDTRLYLIGAEQPGTQWKMVEEAAYQEWLAAVEASNISLTDFNNAVAIYEAAMKLKGVLDEAEEIGADVTAETAVYNNTASTLEELNAAITSAQEAIEKRKQEQAQDNYANATAENPVDVTTLFIKNASYDNNKNDNWEGSTPGFQSYTNAEFYQAVFDTHQSMTGLLEGVYMLGLQAFYRPGWGDGTAYTAYTNKDAQIYDVKMYANSGANSTSQPIVTAYEGAGEKVGQGGEMEVKTAEGTSIWIPNDMNSAAGYFAAGRYHNMMLFEADADSTITIGLKNTKSVAGNWVIYDNWRLVYMGAGDDAYKALATSFASTLPDYSNLGEDVIYTQSYFDTFTAAKAALAEATGKDAVKAAIATAKAAAADIELNISLWQKYQDLCKRANDVAANESYNESAREPLGDYMMDMADFINARTMTNEELQALCDEIEAAIDNAIRTPKDGADVTDYLVNPDFSTNDETGWTGRSSITDIAHSCAEAYEKGDFDLYQVVKNAPLGVYEISLKGFVRDGSNDVAWAAYRDNGAPAAKAFVYMNQKQTPLKNCYDYKFPLSAFDLSQEHIYGPTPYPLLDAAGDSLRNEAGESLWVPNGMSTSQDVFDAGAYQSSAFGLVAKVGDEMRVGIRGNLGGSGSWCWAIWDDFRLTYRGFQRDVVLEVLTEEIANVEKYKSLLIGKNVRDIITAKLAAAEEAKGFEKGQDMFEALTELFTVGDTVRSSQAIFAELEKAYEKLPTAINTSEASNELIQQATNLMNDVYANVLAIEPTEVTWTDDQAKAATAEIEQMIKDLAKPAGFAEATDADPKDANWCIVNPVYANNDNEGWTSTNNPGISYNLCEVYNSNFNYYQDIELTAGTYTLTAPGFYRYGFAADDYTAFNTDPSQNNNLVMYVTIGEDSIAVAMPRLASAAQEYTVDVTVADDGSKSFAAKGGYTWVADPVANADSTQATGFIVANNMQVAADEFAAGNYAGTTITFKVPEDMKVRIGMSKAVQQEGNWCIWGGWKLTYYGKNSSKEVTPTGISAAQNNGQVARYEYFNLNGTRINGPQRGVVIIKQTMADGSVKIRKAVMK